MTNIETILKKFDEKYHYQDGVELLLKSPNHFQIYDVTDNIKSFLSLQITELLQKVNRDNEILVNTILDTHKAQLQKVNAEIEGEKRVIPTVCPRETCESCAEMGGYNSALNLAQEKLIKLIK